MHTLERRPRFETLEQRRMLATVTVDTPLDIVAENDNLTSLREAIDQANAMPGPDEIVFEFGSSAIDTILLTHGELTVQDTLIIGRPGQDQLTIDAGLLSRVFNFAAPGGDSSEGDLTLTGLTIQNGRTSGDNQFIQGSGFESTHSGGAIRFLSTGTLTLMDVTLQTSNTTGANAPGGAIFSPSGNVTLTGSTLTGNLTAGNSSDGGAIYTKTGNVSLSLSTVTGNRTAGNSARGGAIHSHFGTVTLLDSSLTGNRTQEDLADGGAVFADAGDVTITRSTLSGNSTSGNSADGGGIFARSGNVTISESTLSGNSTAGTPAVGGALYANSGSVEISLSSITGNSTAGGSAHGGGIFVNSSPLSLTSTTLSYNSAAGYIAYGGGLYSSSGPVILTGSTVSGNKTEGRFGRGGGITTQSANVQLDRSTLSGNATMDDDALGGGIFTNSGSIALSSSTITLNRTNGTNAHGGAIFLLNSAGTSMVTSTNTIIAGNSVAAAVGPDLLPNTGTTLAIDHTLLGDNAFTGLNESQTPDLAGNLIGSETGTGLIDAGLGPLANNGGPVKTHALLPVSPAIDTGDPAIEFVPDQYDERGEGFLRVVQAGGGLRIDIGAYESQGIPTFSPGDFDRNGYVTAADYTIWRDTLGQSVPIGYAADGDNSGVIDMPDYQVWRDHYGSGLIIVPASSGTISQATTIEAAFASWPQSEQSTNTTRKRTIVKHSPQDSFAEVRVLPTHPNSNNLLSEQQHSSTVYPKLSPATEGRTPPPRSTIVIDSVALWLASL